MRIAAVSDVHSPRYLIEFRDALTRCHRPDIFLLAGDMINYGQHMEYNNVIEAITSTFGGDIPIIACFGNEEYPEVREQITALTEDKITFLSDSTMTIEVGNATAGIVGNSTLADSDSEDIEEIFEKRADHLSRNLRQVGALSTHTILLMHYSPLNEKDSSSFSWLISKAFESTQPDYILHGHIHHSEKCEAIIGKTRIINVAFPHRKTITEFLI